jgi:hypothetical protein
MQLNNKYFYHHPINLEFAVDGEEYEWGYYGRTKWTQIRYT